MNIESTTEVIESVFSNIMLRSTASAMRPSSMIRTNTNLIGSEIKHSATVNHCLRAVAGAATTRSILNLKGTDILTIALVSGYQFSRQSSTADVMKAWIRDWANEKRPEDHIEGLAPEVIEAATTCLKRLIADSPLSVAGADNASAMTVLGWTIGAKLYSYDQDVSSLRVEDFFTDETKETTGE